MSVYGTQHKESSSEVRPEVLIDKRARENAAERERAVMQTKRTLCYSIPTSPAS